MSTTLPAPNDPQEPRDDGAAHHQEGARRRASFVMTEQQVLEALSAIPRMVLLGMLTREQAAITISALKGLLGHYQRSAASGRAAAGGKLPMESLAAILREQPSMLNLLAPLLDDATMDMLRHQLAEGR